ncbi:MAG: hypothetical protein ABIG61_08615 [Planctomycetota bacterium]
MCTKKIPMVFPVSQRVSTESDTNNSKSIKTKVYQQSIQCNYGQFVENGFAFELTNPDTPRQWYHCLSNQQYRLNITHLGSGHSFYRSQVGNQVTRCPGLTNDVGRFFYLRDRHSQEVFSPMIYPVHSSPAKYDDYKCLFKPGSMTWQAAYNHIGTKLKLIVCLDEDIELYHLKLTNYKDCPRTIDCFFYLEWEFSGAPTELGFQTDAYFDTQLNAHIANVRLPDQYRFNQTGFITASVPIIDFDCRRSSFLGTIGTISQPAAVSRGMCSNSPGPRLGEITCGAVRICIELPPKTEKNILFAVGVSQNIAAVHQVATRYQDLDVFEKNVKEIELYWRNYFKRQQMPHPSENLIRFADNWLKYQVTQNSHIGRWGCYRGYRDTLQDAAGLRLLDTGQTKKMLTEAFKHQRFDGHAPRQWAIVPWHEHDWRDYRDSCFWLVYAVEAYLRETGDMGFLNYPSPFIDDAKALPVWEHLARAIDFLWKQRGVHGFCLLGQGDWLDSLNRAGIKGRGESVWLTQAFCWALLKMKELAEKTNQSQLATLYQQYYQELCTAINTHGWDEKWYLMGYDDIGRPIGSAKDYDGSRIFLNTQSWAVIAKVADEQRTKSAFDAVEKYLANPAGYLCFTPAYKKFDPNIGRISIGSTETDAVYSHAVAFKIMADIIRKDADTAYETAKKITPASGIIPTETTGAEPFCCVNSFAGPGWPKPGWNSVGWFTGTAAWLLQIVVEGFFGMRAEYDGLKIEPCLPSYWENARIIRHIRNTSYDVNITKTKGISTGKVELKLDGKQIDGNTLPYLADGKLHTVKCTIINSN